MRMYLERAPPPPGVYGMEKQKGSEEGLHLGW